MGRCYSITCIPPPLPIHTAHLATRELVNSECPDVAWNYDVHDTHDHTPHMQWHVSEYMRSDKQCDRYTAGERSAAQRLHTEVQEGGMEYTSEEKRGREFSVTSRQSMTAEMRRMIDPPRTESNTRGKHLTPSNALWCALSTVEAR